MTDKVDQSPFFLFSHLGSLDLQAQERYSQLLWQLECHQRFIKNHQRLSFMSLNLSSHEVMI